MAFGGLESIEFFRIGPQDGPKSSVHHNPLLEMKMIKCGAQLDQNRTLSANLMNDHIGYHSFRCFPLKQNDKFEDMTL